MITIKKMCFAYPKKQALYKNLSLELSTGSIIGLLGTNGAGKTTLLKLLSGLLSNTGGSIEVNQLKPFGRDIKLLEDTYFIPEEFYLPNVSIGRYVKAYGGFYPKFSLEKFESILVDFDLEKADKIHELSHGQKKKFIVCFALATNCSLLLLDEPTNGLDIPSKALFRKVLAGSIDDDQMVIISTHQVKDVENLIDDIVILKDGKVVFHESINSISETLVFSTGREVDNETAIYSESVPGGVKSIFRQTNGTASDIDIELLFNAVNTGELNLEHHE